MIAAIPPMGELLDSKYLMFLFLPETFCNTEHEYILRWKEKTVKTFLYELTSLCSPLWKLPHAYPKLSISHNSYHSYV